MTIATLFLLSPVVQAHGQHRHDATGEPSRHEDQAGRDIRALSSEEVAGLLAGEGMGLALPAELNGYPGPRHVLELAHELELSQDVVDRIQAVRDSMRGRAKHLGGRIVAAEQRLEQAFGSRQISHVALATALAEIARLRGELRLAHLEAHLAVTGLLSPAQIERYAVLRGYRTK